MSVMSELCRTKDSLLENLDSEDKTTCLLNSTVKMTYGPKIPEDIYS